MFKKFEDISFKIVKFIYFFVMIYVISICLFFAEKTYKHKKDLDYSNWQYMLVGVIVISLLGFILYFCDKKKLQCKHDMIWICVLSIVLFIVETTLAYHYYFKTGWDAQTVEGTARLLAMGQYEDAQSKYFSYYPNNVFITFIFSCIIKIGYLVGIQNYYFSIIIFQCFLFAATGFILYCCAKELLNSIWGFGAWFIYVTFVGLSPWVIIPYTDATGILFPILMFYLYLCIRKSKWISGNLFLLSFFCYLGYSIKPQIAIIGISMLIVEMIHMFTGTVRTKEHIYKISCILCGFLIGMLVVSICIKLTRLEINEELTFGMPHFLMMGMNTESNGVINIEDQDFSMYISTAAERTHANLEVTFERIKAMKFSGFLKHMINKTLVVFADGSFAWWEEGEFYTEEMYDGIYSLRKILSSYFYEHGENYSLFLNNMQALWFGILIYALIIVKGFGNDRRHIVLLLSIVGLFLFEMIFEARARYLFSYAPVFILLSICGVRYLIKR